MAMEELALLAFALLLGLRHALDPDHVVAVTTLVAEERRLWPAAWLGVIWGMGHLLSIAVVGLALFWFRLPLPPRFEEGIEAAIGMLLVGLGMAALWRSVRDRVRFTIHAHNGVMHGHFHRPGHRHPTVNMARRQWITFGIGLLHGLGGSGAVAVLALQMSPTLGVAMLWLLLFGLGSVFGMVFLTLLVAAPTLVATSRRIAVHDGIRIAAGLASLLFGCYMVGSLFFETMA